jgi:hypothetical protein
MRKHGWSLLDFAILCGLAMLLAVGMTALIGYASAQENPHKDRSQWANADPVRKKWFDSQIMNETARKRLGVSYKSCCDNGDVYRTQFRVNSTTRDDEWWYLDKSSNEWKMIPADIIKEEPSIDAQPILFRNRHSGVELCFFLPPGGI